MMMTVSALRAMLKGKHPHQTVDVSEHGITFLRETSFINDSARTLEILKLLSVGVKPAEVARTFKLSLDCVQMHQKKRRKMLKAAGYDPSDILVTLKPNAGDFSGDRPDL